MPDDATQVRWNKRNIDALAQAVEAQGKQIQGLQGQVQTQARSIQTMQEQIDQMHISMSNATSAMGNGATAR